MKRSIAVLSVLFTAALYANGVDDMCISFSTKGPDLYADGSTVLDGECYALVWSHDGVFEGFSADGVCIDTNDVIVLVAPVAKDGRCPKVLFQVSADKADELDGGKYSVFLLDTRVASDGSVKPCGTKNGKPGLINGYGAVTASLGFNKNAAGNAVNEILNSSGGQTAANLSAMPSGCTQPKIKGMRVEGENVYLTVENLKGYMRVQGGKDIRAADTTGAATQTSGDSGDVILVAPKTGTSGFYRVIRN